MRTVKELARRLACEGFISALVCPSAVFLSSTVLRLPLSWDYLLITYLGTHAILLYNRYEELERDLLTNPTRSEYIKKHFKALPVIIAIFFLLALLIPLLQGRILGTSYALLLLFLGLMYPKFFKKHVRVIAFKDAYAAFLLSSVVILAPVYYSYPITPAFLLLFLFIFLRFFVNTCFFDVKDVESDRREGILTLSAALGIEKAIKVLWIMSILSLLPLAFGVILQIFSPWILIFFLILPYTYYFLKQGLVKGAREDIFLYYYIVDGEMVFLWPILSISYFFLQ